MTTNTKSKMKTLYIMRMLQEETDSNHGLTMREILKRLEQEGITAERKSVYRDIESLRSFGIDVKMKQRSPAEYSIDKREFKLEELMLMVDAVQSSRFITERQCRSLVQNIKQLASAKQRSLLDKRIHVTGRIKSKNESVFTNVDIVHNAIRQHKKIRFTYWKTGVNGKLYARHEGKIYELTPVKVVFDDGFYYVNCYNDETERCEDYRIDRMRSMKISIENATRLPKPAQDAIAEDDAQYFGRMDGEVVTSTLHVDAEKVDMIVDRFGKDAQIVPASDGGALATVKVRKSPQFFGWLAGLNGYVTIDKPQALKDEYYAYLKSLIEQ